jgi:hypothetical protein
MTMDDLPLWPHQNESTRSVDGRDGSLGGQSKSLVEIDERAGAQGRYGVVGDLGGLKV